MVWAMLRNFVAASRSPLVREYLRPAFIAAEIKASRSGARTGAENTRKLRRGKTSAENNGCKKFFPLEL